jgi:hypothetical protein
MEVFDQALSKANTLIETMDNFNTHKKRDDNTINESAKNNNIITPLRKNNRQRTYNPKKTNKSQLKPIQNNQIYFRKREPYNYQKEYENELINQIEKLFNPTYKNNGNNEEVGMLSFLSPLINSNIEEKNKKFYKKTLNKKANEFTDDNVDNYKNIEYENSESLHEYKGFWDKGSRTKYAKGTRKLRISKKNSFGSKGFNNYSNVQKLPKMGNKYSFYNNKNNKYNIPEISELKKNRYFSRTKTNLKSKIVARDVSSKSKKNESNVDQLISKLKKHYS